MTDEEIPGEPELDQYFARDYEFWMSYDTKPFAYTLKDLRDLPVYSVVRPRGTFLIAQKAEDGKWYYPGWQTPIGWPYQKFPVPIESYGPIGKKRNVEDPH